jgi:hypothetical protein
MLQMNRLARTAGALLLIGAALVGCSARTNVSATGATPAQFTHVFITAQAVWFNTNENAGPDDGGWAKFPLKTPVTVDLVAQSNGTLGEVADDLRVAPGTYNTILLVPVDPSLAPTANALAIGATFNNEADFVDSSGTTHAVPLVLPNQEKGIVVTGASMKVPVGGSGANGLAALGAGGAAQAGTTNQASTLFNQPTTVNSTTTTTTTGSSTTNNTITVSFAANFDGNRDLHLFNYASNKMVGALLSATPVSSDLAKSGGITGTVSLSSLTSLTPVTSVSGRMAVEACAELLDSTGSHHYIVACAPVQTDGTFTIYPLNSNSDTPTVYDVVIHGPHIATIIVKNVSVATTTPTLTAAATTTGSVATTTATGAVSLGTLIPRQVVQFPVTATAASGGVPAGAAVTFYQTLPASGELPYAIDEVGIDPFNTNLLQTTEYLSAGTIDSGTFSSNGSTITITSSTPKEGAGTYAAAATAPLFTDGIASGGAAVAAPGSTQGSGAADATTAVAVVVPALTNSSGGAITAAVTPASPGKYNQGELIVSHNGAVVGSAALDSVLTSGGNVSVSGLPSGNAYSLSVIVWNSASVSTDAPFTYQSVVGPVNVGGTAAVTIN